MIIIQGRGAAGSRVVVHAVDTPPPPRQRTAALPPSLLPPVMGGSSVQAALGWEEEDSFVTSDEPKGGALPLWQAQA